MIRKLTAAPIISVVAFILIFSSLLFGYGIMIVIDDKYTEPFIGQGVVIGKVFKPKHCKVHLYGSLRRTHCYEDTWYIKTQYDSKIFYCKSNKDTYSIV